jgi:hypothetical protein
MIPMSAVPACSCASASRWQRVGNIEIAARLAVLEIPHQGRGVEVGNRRDAQTSHSCFDSNRRFSQPFVTASLDTGFPNDYSPPSHERQNWSTNLGQEPVAAESRATLGLLEWLAISDSGPGLGPTKARKLVEHFGSADAVFHASLTELEARVFRPSRRSR